MIVSGPNRKKVSLLIQNVNENIEGSRPSEYGNCSILRLLDI